MNKSLIIKILIGLISIILYAIILMNVGDSKGGVTFSLYLCYILGLWTSIFQSLTDKR